MGNRFKGRRQSIGSLIIGTAKTGDGQILANFHLITGYQNATKLKVELMKFKAGYRRTRTRHLQ